MDTKSRSIKPAVAFLAFVLGFSLLFGVGSVLAVALGSGSISADSLSRDYQNTSAFRREVTRQLNYMLAFASGGDWQDADRLLYDIADDSNTPVATFAPASTVEPDASTGELSALPAEEGEDINPRPDPADAEFLEPEDQNMLYVVTLDGEELVSNTDALDPFALPEGYNFALIFDGETVSIWKDKQEVDVYGDGSYRPEDGDWEVPGYRNIPTPEAYRNIKVVLAAAQEPLLYRTSHSYSGYTGLYEVAQDQQFLRTVLDILFLSLGGGAALVVWYILWRKYKAKADRAIAWFTGHIWLEVKVLLLIPTVLSVFWLLSWLDGLIYNPWIFPFGLLLFWWIYALYLNDLRYNFGRLCYNSFCAALARLFRAGEQRTSAQRRAARRAAWQLVAAIPFFLFCIFSVPFLYTRYLYAGFGPILLALLCLGGLALIVLQVLLVRANQKAAGDLDLLLRRIENTTQGRPAEDVPLPADSDFAAAAEQLSRMEAGLRTALEKQMKSERMKVELIANVSHDLKTPLTSLVSYTDLLRQEEDLPQHVKEYIRILWEKTQRLQAMVQDIFEVSKAASGNLPVTLAPLDLAKLLRQTLADMNEAIQESGFSLKETLPAEPVWIEADGDRLYRVFQNLIGNALKYSLPGSRIYLALDCTQTHAEASLRNTSRDELPSGVDFTARFVRGDESRTDGGSGLGLSIARTFTEACGGTFSIDIQADLFTARVRFPLTQRRPEEKT